MALQFSTTLRDNMNTQIINSATAGTTLNIYSGTAPSSVGTALSGNTLLVSLPCSATIGTESSGVLTFNSITQTNATATGTATFFRLLNGSSVAFMQGTVGTSGADLNLNTTSIVSGGPVNITSFTITAAGA